MGSPPWLYGNACHVCRLLLPLRVIRRRAVGVVRGRRRSGRAEHGDDAHHPAPVFSRQCAVRAGNWMLDPASGGLEAVHVHHAFAVEHVDDLVVGVEVVGRAGRRDVADKVGGRAQPAARGRATIRNSRSVCRRLALLVRQRGPRRRPSPALAGSGSGTETATRRIAPGRAPRARSSRPAPVDAALGLERVRRAVDHAAPAPESTNRTSSPSSVSRASVRPGRTRAASGQARQIRCAVRGREHRRRVAAGAPPGPSRTRAITATPAHGSCTGSSSCLTLTLAAQTARRSATPSCNAIVPWSRVRLLRSLSVRLERDLGPGEGQRHRARRLGLLGQRGERVARPCRRPRRPCRARSW